VEVRIILRNGGDTRLMLQALKAFGIPDSHIKLQGGCHNKGIVVDGKAVLVSSQNYSADGVRFNRDAGLIIRHPEVAAYFEEIFEHDWQNRATQRVVGEDGDMPMVPVAAARAPGAPAAEAGPTISWEDFYGD
jgi:phosphatidylserine/phosphatidylglycerophosphate/cardiolipin synthase-like enzyme